MEYKNIDEDCFKVLDLNKVCVVYPEDSGLACLVPKSVKDSESFSSLRFTNDTNFKAHLHLFQYLLNQGRDSEITDKVFVTGGFAIKFTSLLDYFCFDELFPSYTDPDVIEVITDACR